MAAPIWVSGWITRAMGRRDSDSSPPIEEGNGCAARMPLSMRMVDPELPASSCAEGSRSAPPWITTRFSASLSMRAPSAAMQPSVDWQSAPVE